MKNFSVLNLMSNTKQALCAYINEQADEIVALRSKVSELSATVEAALNAPNKREFRSNREVVTERRVKRHTYADRNEAVANCKRLVASELNKRYVFSVQGCEVIAKERVL